MRSCLRCSSSNLTRDGHDQRGRPIHACGACDRHATAESATLVSGLRVTRHVEEALRGADVIMLLRLQTERLAGQKISLEEYIARYQMTAARLKLVRPPVNG